MFVDGSPEGHVLDFLVLVDHFEVIPSFEFLHDVLESVTFEIKFTVDP